MKVTKYPNKIDNSKKTLILGSFSSFHNGHLKLLEEAKKTKNKIMVMLIENPDSLPADHKGVYETLDIRLQKLSNIGVDYTLVIHFDNQIRNNNGQDLLNDIIKTHNIQHIVMGDDFAMGKDRQYKARMIATEHSSTIVDTLKINGNKVSTKHLIESIQLGDFKTIFKVSPFHFWTNVKVDSNNQFTIENNNRIHPGIYAGYLVLNDVKYWASIHICFAGKNIIRVPELTIKNTSYNGVLEFHNKVRTIVKKEHDKLTEIDVEKTAEILENNL